MVNNQVAFFDTLVSGNCVLMQGHSGFVVINTACLPIKSDTVTTDSKLATRSLCDSDSDCGNEFKKDDESLQEAYEKVYTQWLKVCATN